MAYPKILQRRKQTLQLSTRRRWLRIRGTVCRKHLYDHHSRKPIHGSPTGTRIPATTRNGMRCPSEVCTFALLLCELRRGTSNCRRVCNGSSRSYQFGFHANLPSAPWFPNDCSYCTQALPWRTLPQQPLLQARPSTMPGWSWPPRTVEAAAGTRTPDVEAAAPHLKTPHVGHLHLPHHCHPTNSRQLNILFHRDN